MFIIAVLKCPQHVIKIKLSLALTSFKFYSSTSTFKFYSSGLAPNNVKVPASFPKPFEPSFSISYHLGLQNFLTLDSVASSVSD